MGEIKKDIWSIDVRRESVLKVAFAEPVTAADAMLLFDMEEYEDIIDEEDHGTEALRAE